MFSFLPKGKAGEEGSRNDANLSARAGGSVLELSILLAFLAFFLFSALSGSVAHAQITDITDDIYCDSLEELGLPDPSHQCEGSEDNGDTYPTPDPVGTDDVYCDGLDEFGLPDPSDQCEEEDNNDDDDGNGGDDGDDGNDDGNEDEEGNEEDGDENGENEGEGQNSPDYQTPASSSSGGGSRVVQGGSSGGSSGGQVLGASTMACSEPYLSSFIQYGADNDPEEVRKLQLFLNEFMAADLPVTGFYGPLTLQAVERFQTFLGPLILQPWVEMGYLPNVQTPTGYVYKTTRHWINIIKCPGTLIVLPELP